MERARAQLVDLAERPGSRCGRATHAGAPAGGAGRPLCPCQAGQADAQGLRTLKGYTGRVLRDLRPQLYEIPAGPLRERVLDELVLVSSLLRQTPKSGGKIYALDEPQVDCISKGKARVRYEFGTKVSVATTSTAASSSAWCRCRAT